VNDSNPTGRGVAVTIAYGQGKQDTRATFHGSLEEVREDIIDFFGLDSASGIELNPAELVLNATQLAHGAGTLARGLDATAVPPSMASRPTPPPSAAPSRGDEADPWSTAASQTAPPWPVETPAAPAAPVEPAKHPLVEAIERTADLDGLKRLWAENQAAFAVPEVMAAWKTRGRVLSSGTK
jgi:hypothetical protein